jgi:hypothetical protein
LEYSLLKTLTCFVKHTSSITDFPQATKWNLSNCYVGTVNSRSLQSFRHTLEKILKSLLTWIWLKNFKKSWQLESEKNCNRNKVSQWKVFTVMCMEN